MKAPTERVAAASETAESGLPLVTGMTPIDEKSSSSYGQIFRSSSILGGSQGLIYLISIARTKAAALLLGPTGVGTLSLFQSTISLLGTVSGLGIGNSGVREIAEADGAGDATRVRRTSSIVFRVVLITGILGWFLATALAYPISKVAFDDYDHAGSIVILGACLLLMTVGSSYAAILQGTREIGKLAKLQVTCNAVSAAIVILLFLLYGKQAIVPSIIAGALVGCMISWRMGRKTFANLEKITWRETFSGSKGLVTMGIAFMWNAFSTGLVAFGIRVMVVRHDGLDANGIYQAAWGISGMFAGFILQAMGTDFYPRLTAASSDPERMNRLINEQTEIGVLLAGPGVLFTLSMAPFLMEWLYSAKFISGTPVVCWFVMGVFGQVVSWPLGFVQIARGWSRAFIVTQTLFNGVHFGLTLFFYHTFGMVGIGMAYVTLYVIYTASMLVYMQRVNGFLWSREVTKLAITIGALVATGFVVAMSGFGITTSAIGLLLAIGGGFFCTRELLHRLPDDHRLARLLKKLPLLSKPGKGH